MKEYGLYHDPDGGVKVIEFEKGDDEGVVVFEGDTDSECLKWLEEQFPGNEAYIKGPAPEETIH